MTVTVVVGPSTKVKVTVRGTGQELELEVRPRLKLLFAELDRWDGKRDISPSLEADEDCCRFELLLLLLVMIVPGRSIMLEDVEIGDDIEYREVDELNVELAVGSNGELVIIALENPKELDVEIATWSELVVGPSAEEVNVDGERSIDEDLCVVDDI